VYPVITTQNYVHETPHFHEVFNRQISTLTNLNVNTTEGM